MKKSEFTEGVLFQLPKGISIYKYQVIGTRTPVITKIGFVPLNETFILPFGDDQYNIMISNCGIKVFTSIDSCSVLLYSPVIPFSELNLVTYQFLDKEEATKYLISRQ